MLECIHQVQANMLCTFELKEKEVSKDNPCTGILNTVRWAVWSTCHTILQPTTDQLGRDMVFKIAHKANWKDIKDQSKKLTKFNKELKTRKVLAQIPCRRQDLWD